MGSLQTKPASQALIIGNVLLIFLVLVLEKFAIGSHVYSAVKNSHDTILGELLFSHGKAISRSLVLAAVIFLILIQKQLNQYRTLYVTLYSTRSVYMLLAQVGVFGLFYWSTTPAFSDAPWQAVYQTLWVIFGLLLALLTLAAFASLGFWHRILQEQQWSIVLALALSTLVWTLSIATQGLWTHFADLTFYLVAGCLEWFSNDVYVDPAGRIIGFHRFLVNIDTQCSGYEGIGLVTAFVFVFLYSFRADFRFPRALLLFPIGAVVIWLFNVVRIVVLILIGALWSPDVAVWGFHTQAGWITFILTSVGIMWLAHHSAFFVKNIEPNSSSSRTINLPIATLLPLIALLGMTFITQALSGQFDWLYPLRVIVVAGTIMYCLRYLDLSPIQWNYFSIVAGIAVALIWIFMVEKDAELDQLYSATFAQSAGWLVVLWLLFRFIGSAITVPIAEELGFRSYLLCKLSAVPVANRGPIVFSALGFIGSSLAFGLLHGAWLEGTIAGLIYAWVRYRSTNIMDAIIAHGVTNAALFGYVLYTGEWSLL